MQHVLEFHKIVEQPSVDSNYNCMTQCHVIIAHNQMVNNDFIVWIMFYKNTTLIILRLNPSNKNNITLQFSPEETPNCCLLLSMENLLSWLAMTLNPPSSSKQISKCSSSLWVPWETTLIIPLTLGSWINWIRSWGSLFPLYRLIGMVFVFL